MFRRGFAKEGAPLWGIRYRGVDIRGTAFGSLPWKTGPLVEKGRAATPPVISLQRELFPTYRVCRAFSQPGLGCFYCSQGCRDKPKRDCSVFLSSAGAQSPPQKIKQPQSEFIIPNNPNVSNLLPIFGGSWVRIYANRNNNLIPKLKNTNPGRV